MDIFKIASAGWKHNLPALVRAGFRAIAIDTPGFEYSDRPSGTAPDGWEVFITQFIHDLLDVLCLDSCQGPAVSHRRAAYTMALE